jgi:LAO/AO transport system kinase
VATEGEGVDGLVTEIERHQDYSRSHPIGRARERKRVEHLLLRLVESDLREAVLRRQLDAERRREWVEALIARRTDPYSVANQVVRAMLREGEDP